MTDKIEPSLVEDWLHDNRTTPPTLRNDPGLFPKLDGPAHWNPPRYYGDAIGPPLADTVEPHPFSTTPAPLGAGDVLFAVCGIMFILASFGVGLLWNI